MNTFTAGSSGRVNSRLAGRVALIVASACLVLLPVTTGASLRAGDDEKVGVEGSDVTYAASIESTIGGRQVTLVITGTAQRKKSVFRVYTLGSYVEQGVAIKDADELAHKDCAKQLHLIMERGVSGKTMAEAFIEGIHLNYGEEQFVEQKKALLEFMSGKDLKDGDEVWLTHVPGSGFHCKLPGNHETLIKGVPFAVAIWEIYLGKKNIGEKVKAGVTSRLPIGGSH